MKYCLRRNLHTLTLSLGCTAAARLSLHHPASRFMLQSELVSHLFFKTGGGGGGALALVAPPPLDPLLNRIRIMVVRPVMEVPLSA